MARALAYPDDRRKTARLARLSRGLRGLLIPQAVENLRAGEEDRARSGEQQQLAAIAWIFVKISRTARHRADGEGINDQAYRKSKRLNPVLNAHLLCRLLLE